MQVHEAKVHKLIEGTIQYVVPLFQREYSWQLKHWKALWDDVREQATMANGHPHFFGSIVTAPAKSVPHSTGKYLLIDGQQRMTTVQLMLAALRDAATAKGLLSLADKVHGKFLNNQYELGDHKLKLLPTESDRAAFAEIMQFGSSTKVHRTSKLHQAYSYFLGKLTTASMDEAQLQAILQAITERLSLVSIVCDEQDNPHLIFESLNAKGEKLTPADLIRNYLFMCIDISSQVDAYTAYWEPIQKALTDRDTQKDSLTQFVRHYLMKEGKILNDAAVYEELKDRLKQSSPAEAMTFLKDLHGHGLIYTKFLQPSRESDSTIAAALARLQRLESTVTYPLLLRIFDSYQQSCLTRSQVIKSLEVLESLLIRRSVCGVPTNRLRTLLPPVFDAAGGASENFVSRLREQLGGKRCPDDTEFVNALVHQPLYVPNKKNDRLRIILERIEASYAHKESPTATVPSLEHVMPQTLSLEWQATLGANAATTQDRWLHTLGNLTLTAYNSELSNDSFDKKQVYYADSNYQLNKCFAGVPTWNAEAIELRARKLATIALKIWPDLHRPTAMLQSKRVSSKPTGVRYLSKFIAIKTWRAATLRLLELFDDAQQGLLLRASQHPSLKNRLSVDANRFNHDKEMIRGVFVQLTANSKQHQQLIDDVAAFANIPQGDYEYGDTIHIP
jgi:uncharacterized protein with ParB-like and HNH nuclease domain